MGKCSLLDKDTLPLLVWLGRRSTIIIELPGMLKLLPSIGMEESRHFSDKQIISTTCSHVANNYVALYERQFSKSISS